MITYYIRYLFISIFYINRIFSLFVPFMFEKYPSNNTTKIVNVDKITLKIATTNEYATSSQLQYPHTRD